MVGAILDLIACYAVSINWRIRDWYYLLKGSQPDMYNRGIR
jgi:hypothetical protein